MAQVQELEQEPNTSSPSATKVKQLTFVFTRLQHDIVFGRRTISSSVEGLGCRHYQCFMLFCMLALAFSMRTNLSVAIVAMTSPTGTYTDNALLSWTLSQQGIILGAFFWGYIWLQMLAGNLSRKYGAKYFLFSAMLVSSIITILSPLIAYKCNWIVFCVSRIVVGLSQGFCYPCMITHQSKWTPPLEKGRLVSFAFMGTQFGSMATGFVSGYLAASPWGWPSIFYVTGLCGLLMAGVWLLLGADTPDTHPRISAKEKLYIKAALVGASDDSSKMLTPWKEIATSLPLWANLITHCCQNWGYWMLASMMPTFFGRVLNLNMKSNGLFSALPFLLQCVFLVLVSWIDDFIKRRRLLSLGHLRKMFNSIALWGGAVALVAIPLTSSTPASLALFTIAITLNGAIYSGCIGNHTDLSPNFAGLLMGVTNGFSGLASILGPTVTGLIVQDMTSRSEWTTAFDISALLFFLGNLVFIVFGSADVQPWNEPKTEEKVYSNSVHSSIRHKDSLQSFAHTNNNG